ncbi:LacI family DNA-binding transcriptional regulator [Demequina sp. SYSU T00192]|uniref:LacI family DNA-binding transcriptional regulator n=1 Tax=Demequina litoralis TaxID=3051660 RepID=A0ABT8G8V8_9MICO|nr:LacI family DNA-binding transcriptional regulator [Demequina sp. SYSU T00192]MDN4475577.1 LacI family DNA-binding transcriptional regulator [Demequina sp. SYSU T00192]
METARATMRDVAAAAGVSPSLVSFVLNDAPGQTIPEATRARVREAAERLGYAPHGVARALREGAARIVLLDTAGLPHGPSLEAFTQGLGLELAAHDHSLLVHSAGRDDLERAVRAIVPRAVVDLAGLYASGAGEHEDGGWADGLQAHAAVQMRHLLDAGHRGVAIALPAEPGEEAAPLVQRRADQLAAVARDARVGTVVLPVAAEAAAAAAALVALRGSHPGITAVAAFDDATALAVLAAMRRCGLEAPRDLAVMGFDATEAAGLWDPGLTTVEIDAAAYGRRAGRLALGLAPDPADVPRVRVVVRGSA